MKSFHLGNLIVVCLVVAMLIAGSGDPRASAAPTATATLPVELSGRIAFALDSGIYVMNADGTGLKFLTSDDITLQASYYPEWSPDGKRLTFFVNDTPGFHVINADGTGKRRFQVPGVDFVRLAHWSPDGKRFVTSCRQSGDKTQGTSICVVNTDGSNLRIFAGTETTLSLPAWSPDGNKLVFASDHDENSEIDVISADGSGRVNLTNHPARDWEPIWSPDGMKIAFLSDRDAPKSSNIYVMNSDGKNVIRLTNNPLGDSGAVWSPDGKRIAFMRRVNVKANEGYMYVNVMNADGSSQVQADCGGGDFAWSPDGQKLAMGGGFGTYIYIVDVQDLAGPDVCSRSSTKRLNFRTGKTESETLWPGIAWSKQ